MKTIIHIGQHKTATTSIQHYLQSHRSELAKAGLYVPDTLLGYDNPSHFLLNVYALDEARESTAKNKLRESEDDEFFSSLESRLALDIERHYQNAEQLDCREVLWSNEGLFLLNSVEEYVRLRKLFDDFSDTVNCVCCFRDRESFRKSYRRQLDSLGLTVSDDPSSYRYLEQDSWLLDYDRKRNLLSAVFDEVMILSYNPEDMVKSFLESLEYSVADSSATLRLNPTDIF